MKKILLSLVIIILASATAIGVTRAYFSDTEVISNNSFSSAKLDLKLGVTSTLPFSVSNIVPGQNGNGNISLTNSAGSIPGKLSLSLINLVENENDLIEPEVGLDGEEGLGTGELGKFLIFAIYIDVNRDGHWNNKDIQLNGITGEIQSRSTNPNLTWATIDKMAIDWNDITTLTDGQTVDLVISWKYPTTNSSFSENISMTDSLGFDIKFVLNQIP